MNQRFFQAGGSLSTDLPSYIERQADKELVQNIKEGEFCYVLTARQMGKSSLKVRAMKHLEQLGWKAISIDLTAFGTTGFSTEQWYYTFLVEIIDALNIDDTLFDEWWYSKSALTPVARMSAFWEEIILANIEQKIAIFIDEVDTMLSLDNQFSTDDFFAALRAIYNKRSKFSKFERLNFAIFGVATPYDLMSDSERTPFNIGIPIPLQCFSLSETLNLKQGFSNKEATNQTILERILYWTQGQPFLTQSLCQKCSRLNSTLDEALTKVDEVVKSNFFKTDILGMPHFSNIQGRVIANEKYNLRMLDIYRSILKEGNYTINQRNREILYLKLSGLVEEVDEKLQIANPIYKYIFDVKWLEKSYGNIDRKFNTDLQRWLKTNRSKDALLKGTVLTDAEQWTEGRDDLSNDERDFLEASRYATIEETNERRVQEERKKQFRLLAGVLVFALAALVAASFFGYDANKKRTALERSEKQREEVNKRELQNKAKLLAAQKELVDEQQKLINSIKQKDSLTTQVAYDITLRRAQTAEQRKNYSKAIMQFQSAIKVVETYTDKYNNIKTALNDIDSYASTAKKGIQRLEPKLKLETLCEPFINKAQQYRRKKDYISAKGQLEQAIKKDCKVYDATIAQELSILIDEGVKHYTGEGDSYFNLNTTSGFKYAQKAYENAKILGGSSTSLDKKIASCEIK